MLKPIQSRDMIRRLAEHAHASHLTMDDLMLAVRKGMLEHALELEGGNQTRAAKRLGIHRNTITRQMAECGIPLRHEQQGQPNPQHKWREESLDTVAP